MTNTEELAFVTAERIPFDVVMVQVTLQNVETVARWCKGRVVQARYKMMGSYSMLPAIELPRAESKEALIGQWVVEQKGSYRVYREEQLKSTFRAKSELPAFVPDEEKSDAITISQFYIVTDQTSLYHMRIGTVTEVVEDPIQETLIYLDFHDGDSLQAFFREKDLEPYPAEYYRVIQVGSYRFDEIGTRVYPADPSSHLIYMRFMDRENTSEVYSFNVSKLDRVDQNGMPFKK